MPVPMFVSHGNSCRSVLAQYLYEDLWPGTLALSAGVEPAKITNERALAMLRHWGIDAGGHRPRLVDAALCSRADAIFFMGRDYLCHVLDQQGIGLADKCYLFADPFCVPMSFLKGEFLVLDPSFDNRPVADLVKEFAWFRERLVQIHEALKGAGRPLLPASRYLPLLGYE